MADTPTEAISFAWTANHETADYQHFPPYVNLTGNRLVLRGDERTEHGNKVTGPYVAVELPDEAIAELREALRSSAPQEPDRLWLWKNFVGGKPEYWAFDNPFPTIDGGDPMTLGQPCGWAILKPSVNGRPDVPVSKVEAAIKRSVPQEPVVDDDAEWLRLKAHQLRLAGSALDADFSIALTDGLERIANRLQAKAPETPYCGIVVMPGDEAPETEETP